MISLSRAFWLILACAAHAQTYVVSASGGGDFSDLQPAITSVPSGSVLRVRPGVYLPFVLQNKSLTILGDGGVVVRASIATIPAQTIGPTTPDQTLVIKNLHFEDFPPMHFRLTGLAGPAHFEDIRIGFSAMGGGLSPGTPVTITNCANVHWLRCALACAGYSTQPSLGITSSHVELAHCSIKGLDASSSTYAVAGGVALQGTTSRLTLVSSTLLGGHGAPPTTFPYQTGRAGGSAVLISPGTVLHAYGAMTVLQGGVGGNGQSMGGNGGSGLEVSNSKAALVGVSPAGAPGGSGATPGLPGAAIISDALSSVRSIPSLGPSLTISGNVALGGNISIDLNANPLDVATLFVGQTPAYVMPPFWLTIGTMFVDPLFSCGAFQIPASGRLSIPLQLPHWLPSNQLFSFQCATLSLALAEIWASNATSVVIRSP